VVTVVTCRYISSSGDTTCSHVLPRAILLAVPPREDGPGQVRQHLDRSLTTTACKEVMRWLIRRVVPPRR
jgi:hypothetical protein